MHNSVYKISDAIKLLERGCEHNQAGKLCDHCRHDIASYLKSLGERLASVQDIIRTELR